MELQRRPRPPALPIRRRTLLGGLVAAGAAGSAGLVGVGLRRSAPSPARTPAPVRVYRVGWIIGGSPPARATSLTTRPDDILSEMRQLDALTLRFVERLAELGYVEDQNLQWEVRRSPLEELAATAAELVALKVDVFVVFGGRFPVLRTLWETPGHTPVVFVTVTADPVGQGYAQSLARPGGKVTGVMNVVVGGQRAAKQFEVLKDVLPSLQRLGVLLDSSDENSQRDGARAGLPGIARSFGVDLVWQELGELDQMDEAVAALARAGAEAIWPVLRQNWHGPRDATRLIDTALGHRLPVAGLNQFWPNYGAVCVYAPDLLAIWARGADYVDKILRGTWAGEIPIEQPTHFEFGINKRTADILGLTIPPAVLSRATRVIQ